MTDPRIIDQPHSPWQRELYLLRRDKARYFVRLAKWWAIRLRARWGR